MLHDHSLLVADIPWPDIPDDMSEDAHDIISKLLNPKYVPYIWGISSHPPSLPLVSPWDEDAGFFVDDGERL
jgi:hypothetical protein